MEYYKYLRQHVGHKPIILPGSVAIIWDDEGRYLIEHRNSGEFGLPGGLMDLGESFEDVVKREVFEETGLMIDAMTFVKIYSGQQHHTILENGDEIYVITAVYAVTEYHGTLTFNKEESKGMSFYHLDEIPGDFVPAHRKILDDYFTFSNLNDNVLK